MITIAIAAQKGGVGKSTLTAHLAVEAAGAGLSVAVFDTDRQASLVQWAADREDIQVEACQPAALDAAAARLNVDLLFIDTAPSHDSAITSAARLADLVLVPCRPAIFDLRAVAPTVALVLAIGKAGMVILNQCPAPRGFGEPAIVREARAYLADAGLPVAQAAIAARADLAHALIGGQAVQEFAPNGKAANEITTLWKEIQCLVSR